MPGFWEDNQLGTSYLFVSRLRQRGIDFIVVAYQNESWHFDRVEPVHVLNRFQIAVDDELAVLAPHLAIEIPGHLAAIQRVVVGVGTILIEVRKVSLAPGSDHVIVGIAVLFVVFAMTIQAGSFRPVNSVA